MEALYPRAVTAPSYDVHVHAQAVIRLSEMYHARTLILDPRLRLSALLAMLPAAKRLGAHLAFLRNDIRNSLEQIAPCFASGRGEGDPRFEIARTLWRWVCEPSEEFNPVALQLMIRGMKEGRRVADLSFLVGLLQAGEVDLARECAPRLSRPHLSASLAQTGLHHVGGGRARMRVFVGSPSQADRFPVSRPMVLALLARLIQQDAVDLSSFHDLFFRLSIADQERILPYLGVHACKMEGFEAAQKVIQRCANRSLQGLGAFLVGRQALTNHCFGDVGRLIGGIQSARWRERLVLSFARVLLRKGAIGGARSLLARVRLADHEYDRMLLGAELDHAQRNEYSAMWAVCEVVRRVMGVRFPDQLRVPRWEPLSLLERSFLFALHCRLTGPKVDEEHCPLGILACRGDMERLLLRPMGQAELFSGRSEKQSDVAGLAERMYRRVPSGLSDTILAGAFWWQANLLPKVNPQPGVDDAAWRPESVQVEGLLGRIETDSVPVLTDSNSRLRAAFDEGVSLSSAARSHRKALLRGAKQALKSGSVDEGLSPSVASSRLRTLLNIGGETSVRLLVHALRSGGSASLSTQVIFDALASLDARRALSLLIREGGSLETMGLEIVDALVALEGYRVVEEGFADAYLRFSASLSSRFRGEIRGAALFKLIFSESGSLPRLSAIRALDRELLRGQPVDAPEGLVTGARQTWRRLTEGTLCGLLDSLSQNAGLIHVLQWMSPSEMDRFRTWSVDRWRFTLRRLRSMTKPAPKWVGLLLERIPGRKHIFSRHRIEEEASLLDFKEDEALWSLGTIAHQDYRVRPLHKCRDLLTYLRLGDGVSCCLNSNCRGYLHARVDGQGILLRQIRDPLTFGLLVEGRHREEGWIPRGFLFGGFAWTAFDDPVVWLNGIYLRRQIPELRSAILARVENKICRPLGIPWLCLASRHGGKGSLPAPYEQKGMRMFRARGLRLQEKDRIGQDDIGSLFNQWDLVPDLYWKRVS